jgi:hypothetical protein
MTMVVPLSHMVVISHLLLQPLARCASFSWPYRSCLRSESISTTANSLQLRLTRHDHHFVWSFVLPPSHASVACELFLSIATASRQRVGLVARCTCMRFDKQPSRRGAPSFSCHELQPLVW